MRYQFWYNILVEYTGINWWNFDTIYRWKKKYSESFPKDNLILESGIESFDGRNVSINSQNQGPPCPTTLCPAVVLLPPFDTPCHKPLMFMLNLVSAKACHDQNIWTWTRFFLHLSRKKRDKTETKQKTMVNKTKFDLKIVHKKKSNSIKGRLITYGLRTSSA